MQRREFFKSLLTVTTACVLGGTAVTAMAKPGRPASPTSVAGVRRRHRRRYRRRVHRGMSLSYLPYGCTVTRVRAGRTYYYCGGIWYRPSYRGTTVVYIVEDIDSGADTYILLEE